MEVSALIPKMLIFVVLMVIGYLCAKTNFAGKEFTRDASKMVINVFMTATIINSVLVTDARLSGGECQRAAIARALICSPKLLICDEATSALDVLIQAQIIDLLKKLKREKKTSILFITHDIPLTSVLCDRTAVMSRGRIAEIGKTGDILFRPASQVTKDLLSSVLTVPKTDDQNKN